MALCHWFTMLIQCWDPVLCCLSYCKFINCCAVTTLPWPSAAGSPCSSSMGTSVVLLDSAVGIHSVADVGAAFESGIQTQEQVDTVKVFHFMHHPLTNLSEAPLYSEITLLR